MLLLKIPVPYSIRLMVKSKYKIMNKKTTFGFSTFELLLALVIVCVLSAIVLSKMGEVRLNNRNDQRKSDVVALQTAIDTYKAANAKYPSSTQINSPDFRKSNLKTLNDNYLKDPRWNKKTSICTKNTLPTLEDNLQPTANCYGYAVSPLGCDNANVDCTSYSLTVTLEPNQLYTKQSSD